jgi:hypothetical protein
LGQRTIAYWSLGIYVYIQHIQVLIYYIWWGPHKSEARVGRTPCPPSGPALVVGSVAVVLSLSPLTSRTPMTSKVVSVIGVLHPSTHQFTGIYGMKSGGHPYCLKKVSLSRYPPLSSIHIGPVTFSSVLQLNSWFPIILESYYVAKIFILQNQSMKFVYLWILSVLFLIFVNFDNTIASFCNKQYH